MPTHIVTLTCADRPGIVHAVTGGLLDVGANITESAQFNDDDTDTFCMRTVAECGLDDPSAIETAVAARLDDDSAELHVRRSDIRPRVLIMVSRHDHCLADLLYRWNNGLIGADVVAVVSNHPDCQPIAERYGLDYHHLPITKDPTGPTSKPAQEAQLVELVERYEVDLVVLARYMQVLSNDLCERLAGRAINIHHSFLPGFKGARPYHQAHARGVKLVGATAHFVTGDLDEGPIIEQDVERVGHAHSAEDLVALGQDIERLVLARAVKAWVDDRVLLIGDRTIVFA